MDKSKKKWSLIQNTLQQIKQQYFVYDLVFVQGFEPSVTIQRDDQQSNENEHNETYMKNKITFTFLDEVVNNQEFIQLNKLKQFKRPQLQNIQSFGTVNSCFYSLINRPSLFFYLLFASNLVLPLNKKYKSAVNCLLQKIGIPAHWKKGSNYYKAVFNEQDDIPSAISWKDIQCMQQLQSGLLASNQSIINFTSQITTIKMRNSFEYSMRLYESLLEQRLIKQNICQNSVQVEHAKIVQVVECTYNFTSSLNRCNILQNSIYTNSSQKVAADYSLKKLKEQIFNRLVHQKDTDSSKMEMQSYEGFVYQNIEDLFVIEFEQAKNQNIKLSNQQSQNMIYTYQKVIKQVSQHMEVDYKCKFLMELLIKHIFENVKNEKIVSISPISAKHKLVNQSQSQILLSFQQESQQLLLSQSTQQINRQLKGIEIHRQTQKNQKQLQDYIKYLQEILKQRNIGFESSENFTINSMNHGFIKKDKTLENIEKCSKLNGVQNFCLKEIILERKNSLKYLDNKIQQLKKQNVDQKNTIQNKNNGRGYKQQSIASPGFELQPKPLQEWRGTNKQQKQAQSMQIDKLDKLNKLPKPIQINKSQSKLNIKSKNNQKQQWKL